MMPEGKVRVEDGPRSMVLRNEEREDGEDGKAQGREGRRKGGRDGGRGELKDADEAHSSSGTSKVGDSIPMHVDFVESTERHPLHPSCETTPPLLCNHRITSCTNPQWFPAEHLSGLTCSPRDCSSLA